MEPIAWAYVHRGNIAAAGAIFTTLAQSEGRGRDAHRQRARWCRVLSDPAAVPLPHRHSDIVAALLADELPAVAVFGPCVHARELAKAFKRIAAHVHPDKNPLPEARAAFQRLQDMRAECQALLPDGDAAAQPTSPLTPVEVFGVRDRHAAPPVAGGRKTGKKKNVVHEDSTRAAELSGLLSAMRTRRSCRLACDLSSDAFEHTRTSASSSGGDDSSSQLQKCSSGVGGGESSSRSSATTLDEETCNVLVDSLRSQQSAGSLSGSLCGVITAALSSAISESPRGPSSLSAGPSVVTAAAAATTSGSRPGARSIDETCARRQRSVTLLRSLPRGTKAGGATSGAAGALPPVVAPREAPSAQEGKPLPDPPSPLSAAPGLRHGHLASIMIRHRNVEN